MRTSRLPLAAAALAAAALAAAALAVPTAAQAKLPSFADASFAANVGIGGAKIGQTRAAALHAWGGASRGDCNDFGCTFGDTRRPNLGYGNVGFEDGKRGRVSKLVLSVGRDPRTGKPIFDTPLTAIEGPGGIKLGSSQRAVKAVYPKSKAVRGATNFLSIFDSRGDQTLFDFDGHRLAMIIMQDRRPRG